MRDRELAVVDLTVGVLHITIFVHESWQLNRYITFQSRHRPGGSQTYATIVVVEKNRPDDEII